MANKVIALDDSCYSLSEYLFWFVEVLFMLILVELLFVVGLVIDL